MVKNISCTESSLQWRCQHIDLDFLCFLRHGGLFYVKIGKINSMTMYIKQYATSLNVV